MDSGYFFRDPKHHFEWRFILGLKSWLVFLTEVYYLTVQVLFVVLFQVTVSHLFAVYYGSGCCEFYSAQPFLLKFLECRMI